MEDDRDFKSRRKTAIEQPGHEKSKFCKVFGRFPAKPVEVELKPESNPSKMMEGMEDFYF